VGLRAWKAKAPKNADLETKLASIFNQDKMISRWRKSYTFRKDMKYLAMALLKQQFLTKGEYESLEALINGNKLKGIFNEGAALRKEFKKFAIACVRGQRISWNSFKRFETFTPYEVEQLIDATIKWKISAELPLTAEETKFKYMSSIQKKKAIGVTPEETHWYDYETKKGTTTRSLSNDIASTRAPNLKVRR
jgi:hypothetical protein